jgi:hypothetical protein
MRKNLPIIFISIVFAALLWLWVSLKGEYQTNLKVALVPTNIKQGKTLLKPLPRDVTVEFKGEGLPLAALYFSSNMRYILDLTNVDWHIDYVTNQNLSEHVKSPSGVHPIAIRPDTISVFLDDYVEKTVPASPQLDIEFRENFGQIGKIIVEPESIKIFGAKTVLRDVKSWETKKQHFSDIKSDVRSSAELSDSLSSLITPARRFVRLHVIVQRIAEEEFKGLGVEVHGVPENREVLLIPPQIDLLVRGGVEQLASLDRSYFAVSIDYKTILFDTTGQVAPAISAPEEIKIIRKVPEQIQYVIRKKYASVK